MKTTKKRAVRYLLAFEIALILVVGELLRSVAAVRNERRRARKRVWLEEKTEAEVVRTKTRMVGGGGY